MSPQKQHHKRQSAFNSRLFQIFGSKWWIHNFFQYPLTSAAQPVRQLQDLLEAWKEYKDSEDHKQAVRKSQQKQDDVKRRSQQVWQAKKNYERGRKLTFDVNQSRVNFFDLPYDDKVLVEDFNAGKLANKIKSLLPPALSLGTEHYFRHASADFAF